MRRRLRNVLIGLVLAGVAGVALFFAAELNRLSAIRQHPEWAYNGIALVRDAVVAVDARDVEVPPGFEPVATPRNAALFQTHCAQCHGAPGLPPEAFALGMNPVPAAIAHTARARPAREVFWFVKYGLKMSGMPAWERRLSEAEMWEITALVKAIPRLSPTAYQALLREAGVALPQPEPERPEPERRLAAARDRDAGGPEGGARNAATLTAAETGVAALGDAERGRATMRLYACRSCHLIPGLVGKAGVRVGPDLAEAGARRYIAGVLLNTPDNMARWLRAPQAVDPLSAMPDLGVDRQDAADMAAYLYSLVDETLLPPGATRAREASVFPGASGQRLTP
jgi:mono/diheme cytochrome c family protein